MKQLILLLLLTPCINAYAQDSIQVWNKWCSQKDTMLLFDEGNNIIQLYSPTLKPADIKIRSLDKALRIGLPEIKGDTLSVVAMPFPEKGKTMRLLIQYKKNSREIKKVSFVSDSIPQLRARVGTIQTGAAQKKDILVQTTLRTYFPGSLYSYPYHISGYTFKTITAKGPVAIPVKGNFLVKDVLQEINNTPPGVIITFTSIKATCQDCATRTLPDVRLKIQ